MSNRAINRLSARAVQTQKTPGLYADGGGLYLRVAKSGQKQWTFIYHFQKRRREMGFGGFADVSLAEARQKRDEARPVSQGWVGPARGAACAGGR